MTIHPPRLSSHALGHLTLKWGFGIHLNNRMNRNEQSYAVALLHEAVHRLAAGSGTLPRRLERALEAMHAVRPLILPPALADRLRCVWQNLVAGSTVSDGTWGTMIQRMHRSRRARMASSIVELYAGALWAVPAEPPDPSATDLLDIARALDARGQ